MKKFRNKYRIESHRRPNWDYNADGLYFLTVMTQHAKHVLGKIVNREMQLSAFGEIVKREFLKSFEIRKELILHVYVIMPNHLHMIVEIKQPTPGAHSQLLPPVDAHDHSQPPAPVDAHDQAHPSHHDAAQPHAPDAAAAQPQAPHDAAQPHALHDAAQPHAPHDAAQPHAPHDAVQMHGRASLRDLSGDDDNFQSELSKIKRNPPQRLPHSISSFMAGYKSAVNTQICNYIDEHRLKIRKYNRNNHFFQMNYHDHIIRNDREYKNITRYIINNPKNWRNDSLNRG